MKLPDSAGPWRLEEAPRRIGPETIFDYMNGAGELYLGYRFRYVDAYEYTAADDSRILVEIYQMKSSDDAFGLLSLDWGGEPVGSPSVGRAGEVPRALYGAGLLRVWSSDIYARVLAETDSAATRAAVIELGQAITDGRPSPPPPDLLRLLPEEVSGYRILKPRVSYFRSYLVLNSIYFLSSENILTLDLDDEAATALFESGSGPGRKTARLIHIRYADERKAQAALRSFLSVYLGDKADRIDSGEESGSSLVEDGWMGFRREKASLILVFESPDQETVQSFLRATGEMP